MTNRRKTKDQAAPLNRRSRKGANGGFKLLKFVPRGVASTVASAAGQSVQGLKPNLLRYIDLHPAMAVLTAVAIIAAVCVIYLSQVTAVTTANYTVQRLQSEHTALQRAHDDLQLQIGRAQSLTTIQTKAHDILRMVPIGDQYTYLPIAAGPLTALPPMPTPAALPTPTPGDTVGANAP